MKECYKCTQCHYEFEHIKKYKTDPNPLCSLCRAPVYELKIKKRKINEQND